MNQDNNNPSNKTTNDINLYENSLEQLQKIVALIEDKETSFADLVKNMTVAKQLVDDCKTQLKGITKEIEQEN